MNHSRKKIILETSKQIFDVKKLEYYCSCLVFNIFSPLQENAMTINLLLF